MLAGVEEIRQRLDEVDDRLLSVLAERCKFIDELAELKSNSNVRLRDEAREQAILQRVAAQANRAGLNGEFVTRIFRQVIDYSVRRQLHRVVDGNNGEPSQSASSTVAYQGIDGAFSHLAAIRHFEARNGNVTLRGHASFREVVDAVQSGNADYGMLPVENTTAGSINEVYDLLATSGLRIVGEEVETVDHCLLGIPGSSLNGIRRIRSHPQALAQCTRFLNGLQDCRAEAFDDTAAAARQVRLDDDASEAAIASASAAERYGLQILERSIANQQHNYTRFVVVAVKPISYQTGLTYKTSIMLVLRHEVGALTSCLEILTRQGLNLTKIESRPKPEAPWEYRFYLDFEGNAAEEHVTEALRQLAVQTTHLKMLGSYPTLTPSRSAPPALPLTDQAGVRDLPGTGIGPHPTGLASEKKPYTIASRVTRAQDTHVIVGDVTIGDKPVVIAGPCSVESREQLSACAEVVKQSGGDILRGGCFKPRTSPYAFQGLGDDGLTLLRDVGRDFGLPVVTEVLHPGDAERVAAQVDMLQIGARNMQNFALLKAVGRLTRPVILKRGMMASIDEWLGAAEYILSEGNQQVILCERGIRTFETATRFTLDLAAVQVVRERTHLPIIVDPSHACGVARWVPTMAEASLAAGAQGIMVEIHPEPDKALSDGAQSLEFAAFRTMMRSLNALPNRNGSPSRTSTLPEVVEPHEILTKPGALLSSQPTSAGAQRGSRQVDQTRGARV
jgi:chorismate mutase/prephenate dehydratase